MRYYVEDATHAEVISSHDSREAAMAEVARVAAIPCGELPNVAPCSNGLDCERDYEIVEYDDAHPNAWKEVRRDQIVTVTKDGAVWNKHSSTSGSEES